MYSFAVVMWSLLTSLQPHQGMTTMQVWPLRGPSLSCSNSFQRSPDAFQTFSLSPKYEPQTLAAQVMYNVVNKGMRPPLPEELPPRYRSLIEACWSERPEDRCAHVLALRPTLLRLTPAASLGFQGGAAIATAEALLPWPRWLPQLLGLVHLRSGTSSVR